MLIKQSELSRSICILDNKLKNKEETQPFCLSLSRASALTEDLEDEDFDRHVEDQSVSPVLSDAVKRNRKRRDYSGVTKRRSASIKTKGKG